MSQAGIINTSSGPVPPTVPTSFVTDSGTAIPAANILNVLGIDASTNDLDGVTTTGSGNTLNVVLTNRITGTATTTDAVTPVNIYTFPLGATPGTYLFNAKFVAYNLTDSLSAGYMSTASVRTTGAAGTVIDAANSFYSEEGAMSGTVITNSVSGNDLVLTVTGLAGKTIHYVALTDYIFVS